MEVDVIFCKNFLEFKTLTLGGTGTEILDEMCRANHLDRDIYNLFIKSGIHLEYAQEELDPSQIDLS